ncbi:MAG: choice-of-anchor J domain-containing protein [Candidatus Cloacimonadales bacterium]
MKRNIMILMAILLSCSLLAQNREILDENFDASTSIPQGWGNGGSSETGWIISDGAGLLPDHTTGSGNMAIFQAVSIPADQSGLLTTPQLLVTEENNTLSFWLNYWLVFGDFGSSSQLYCDISTDNGENWQEGTLNYLDGLAGEGWNEFALQLDDYQAETVNVRFRAISDYGSYNISLDDVSGLEVAEISEVPGAAEVVYPADLSADIVPNLTFTWAATSGNPEGYKFYLGTTDTPDEWLDLGNTNSYTVSELLAFDTQYYWQVIPYNSLGETEDCPVWSFSTSADNSISQFPWSEDFNQYTTSDWPPVDWQRGEGELTAESEIVIPAYGWACDDFANITEPPNKSARINIYGTARNNWLFTPLINLDNCPDAELSFDIALTQYGANTSAILGSDDRVDLIISTDGGLSWSENNALIGWNAESEIGITAQEITLDLGEYSGYIKLGFYGESFVANEDVDFFVDNLQIASTSVFPPTDLVYSLDENLVNLSWQEPTEAQPSNYKIYRNTEFLAETTSSNFTDEITLSGLYSYYVTALYPSGESAASNSVEVEIELTEITEDQLQMVNDLQSYPNPFYLSAGSRSASTKISFTLAENDPGSLKIYNSKGQLVYDFGSFAAGKHSVSWQGKDQNGKPVSSGNYYYQLKTKQQQQLIKLSVIK